MNDKAADGNSAGAPSFNASLVHPLQPHGQMLQDYTHGLYKAKANSMAVAAKEKLTGSV